MAFKDVLDKHDSHTVVIIPRFIKGRPRLVPGLYCEDCGKLIKWLNEQVADELIRANGVEVLPTIKQDKIKLFQQQLNYRYGTDSQINRL